MKPCNIPPPQFILVMVYSVTMVMVCVANQTLLPLLAGTFALVVGYVFGRSL
jgi:hypothetical protein